MAADSTCLCICSEIGDARSLKSLLDSQHFSPHSHKQSLSIPAGIHKAECSASCSVNKTCLSRRDRRKNFPTKAEQGCASAVAQQETTGEENSSLGQSPSAVETSSPEKHSREDLGVQAGGFWKVLGCSHWSSAHGVALPNPP